MGEIVRLQLDIEPILERLSDLGITPHVRWRSGPSELLFSFEQDARISPAAIAAMDEARRLFRSVDGRSRFEHASVRDGLAVQDVDRPAWTFRTLSPEEVAARFPEPVGTA